MGSVALGMELVLHLVGELRSLPRLIRHIFIQYYMAVFGLLKLAQLSFWSINASSGKVFKVLTHEVPLKDGVIISFFPIFDLDITVLRPVRCFLCY